jgi:hypothetical protein
MTTQKATAILKRAGLKKIVVKRENFKSYRVGDYDLSKLGNAVAVELYGNKVQAVIDAFTNAGYKAFEPSEGCGLVKVL